MDTCRGGSARRVGTVARRVGLTLACIVALSSCGTRVHNDPLATGAPRADGAPVSSGEASSLPSFTAPAGAAVGTPQPAGAATTAGASGASRPNNALTAGSAPTRSRVETSGSAAPSTPTPAQGGNNRGNEPTPSAGAPAGGVPLPPASPGDLVIANVGIFSGPVGSGSKPILQGAQLWVKYINAQGGLNGHLVKYLAFDDSGDPARHRALVQEAVERFKVAAFLSNIELLSGRSSIQYLEQVRVPVIGNTLGEDWSYDTPMQFPQATSSAPMMWTSLAAAAGVVLPQGKTRVGSVSCTEADVCRQGDQIVAQSSRALGLSPVYRGQVSLAQPDFTAECLAAQNAKAELMMLYFDVNSVRRFANSCRRQGYQPMFGIPSGIQVDSIAAEPGFDGMINSATTSPYFQTGTPASDEFRQAIARFGQGIPEGVGVKNGWVAGKLLERAARDIPGLPTNESLLKGLWSIKNEDLGGLTRPLTFTENKPADALACWWTLQIKKGAWTSPDGFQRHCQPWGDPRGHGYGP